MSCAQRALALTSMSRHEAVSACRGECHAGSASWSPGQDSFGSVPLEQRPAADLTGHAAKSEIT